MDKINNYCKKGFTFYDDNSWKAPFDGNILLTGIGNTLPNTEYSDLGQTFCSYQGYDGDMSKSLFYDLNAFLYADNESHRYYEAEETETYSLNKNTIYSINFNVPYSSKDNIMDPVIKFGSSCCVRYCREKINVYAVTPELPADGYMLKYELNSLYRFKSTVYIKTMSGAYEEKKDAYSVDFDVRRTGFENTVVPTQHALYYTISNLDIHKSKENKQFLTVKYSNEIIKNMKNEYDL